MENQIPLVEWWLRVRQSTFRWLAPLTFIVTIVIVIGAMLIASGFGMRHANSAGVLHARLTISTLATAELQHPSSVAFAPDSHHLAVIGALAACGGRSEAGVCGHALVIYALNADESAITDERIIPLEPLLGLGSAGVAALRLTPETQVLFTGLGWSPDGARIAIVFTVFQGPGRTLANEVFSGLLVIAVAQQKSLLIVGDSGYFTPSSDAGVIIPIWRIAAQDVSPAYTLAPGLTYAWDSSGFPYPAIPLNGGITQLPLSASA
ncbi:MAG TPA: hypothetical protein VKQ36_02315, partial [Ktedonobacterales bacterium]|nr:hypothetical protein [Ktedonobacterales bacterium]